MNRAGGTKILSGVVCLAALARAEIVKALKPFGLSPGRFSYLMLIKQIGRLEGLSQQEIARRLLVDRKNVTNDLDGLEEKGWIVRMPGPDRRSKRIKITAQGEELLAAVQPIYDGAVRRFTQVVPQADQRQLLEILARWQDAVRESGGFPNQEG